MYYNEAAASPALSEPEGHCLNSPSDPSSWVSRIPFFPSYWKMDLNGSIPRDLRTAEIQCLHLYGSTTVDSDKEIHRMFDWFLSRKLPYLERLDLFNMALTNANCTLLQRHCFDSLFLNDCEDDSDSFQNLSSVEKLFIFISKRPSTKIHVPQGVEELFAFFREENIADSTNDTPKLSIYADKCSKLNFM
jgi:hypothetical protein